MSALCRHIRQWIDSYRDELYIAVALDRLIDLMNSYLEEVGEEDLDATKITKEDVKKCLDDTVKIIASREGREVLWLWNGHMLLNLINNNMKGLRLAALRGPLRWAEVL